MPRCVPAAVSRCGEQCPALVPAQQSWCQDCSRCPGAGCGCCSSSCAPEGSMGWALQAAPAKALPCLAPAGALEHVLDVLKQAPSSRGTASVRRDAAGHPPLGHSRACITSQDILLPWIWRLEAEPWSPGRWCLLQSQPCTV